MNTGVLVRYFADDDPPRALAAARLIDGDDTLVVSTGVLIEVAHVLRTQHSRANPEIADALVAFLTKRGVELAAAADRAGCDIIATFDEALTTSSVPVRML